MADPDVQVRPADFPVLRSQPTRWHDNDHYGHVNNVVYYSYFDTAVNGYLMEATQTDIRQLEAIGLVVETSCRHLAPASFPDHPGERRTTAGLSCDQRRTAVGLTCDRRRLAVGLSCDRGGPVRGDAVQACTPTR